MKLGTETGSLTNHLLSGTKGEPKPKVGMGATILGWTDRHAATIIRVTPTQVHVQKDRAIRLDSNGMSESQQYRYERDTDALVLVFRKTKKGWKGHSGFLRVGDRNEYHDYSF